MKLNDMTNDELLTKAETMLNTGEARRYANRFGAILGCLRDRPKSAGETARLVSLEEAQPGMTSRQADEAGSSERPTVEA